MRATLTRESFGSFLVTTENRDSYYVQSDWDLPALCDMLGHSVACCGATDGTVYCNEHRLSPRDFIDEAVEWLDEHAGETFDIDWPTYSDCFTAPPNPINDPQWAACGL